MSMRLIWSQLSLKSATPGSLYLIKRWSNSITIACHKVYVYGAEQVPRVPIGNEHSQWVIDLKGGPVTLARSHVGSPFDAGGGQ
ncbi:hypothetical protein B0H10DRAFT_2440060 [Mycena sp. CBHHK59/15]|nr:hypothetical protein B0H10DRAFT_2440060 [Mycena sp. CBHHK59/15]